MKKKSDEKIFMTLVFVVLFVYGGLIIVALNKTNIKLRHYEKYYKDAELLLKIIEDDNEIYFRDAINCSEWYLNYEESKSVIKSENSFDTSE